MSSFKIISGQTFGRLTTVEDVGRSSDKKRLWRCRCTCGNETVIRGTCLTRGTTKSCGCWRSDNWFIQKQTHGESNTRLYRIWSGMRNRCANPGNQAFPHYGGRGIRVCAEWQQFELFRDWANAHGYRDDLSIERRNNDGNYEPNNCAWIPINDQWRNQRGDLMTVRSVIRSDGKVFSRVTDAARETGVTTTNIASAIKRNGTSGGYGWRYG